MGELVQLGDAVSEKKGLTWRSLTAFIFLVFIIQPAIVYNWLVNGLWGLSFQYATMSWSVILLWVGLTRLLGSPLTSSEIFVIRMVESTAFLNTGYYFAYLLRNQYWANSDIAQQFGLQHEIPAFFSPLGQDAVRSMLNRTFIDPAWALPILISVCVPVLLTALANYALGLLAFSLYVREEKLEFPVASWDAKTMRAFGQRDLSRIRIIALAIVAGAVYGFGTNGLTAIFGFPLVPRLLIDFTYAIENLFPGASFSFTTELIPYLYGFIVPLKYTAAQFVASIALYGFGTAYITGNGLWPPESEWSAGLGVLWLFNRSTLYFWNSFTIGWALAISTIPLLIRYKTLIRAFSRLREGLGGSGERWLNGKYVLLLYLAATSSAVVLTKVLLPGFPLWILVLFTIGLSFVTTLLQTQAAGVAMAATIPYLRETMIYFSGYRGLDVWFLPQELVVFTGGSGVAQQLLQASVLDVNIKEYTKTYFLISVLGLAGSFTFVSIFWHLNPVPGWAYPYTISAWPVEAMNFWRWQSWLWTGLLFGPSFQINLTLPFSTLTIEAPYFMSTGFGLGTLLYLVSDLVFHLPSFPIAMATAMLVPPFIVLAMFAGSLTSHVISRFAGREFWESNKGFIFIGVTVGDGLVATTLVILELISRSTWLMPY